MPTYEYACRDCGEHLEVVQSFKDDPLERCGTCGGALRKVFSAAGIIFKGSGYYVTDSRTAAKGSTERSGDGSAGTSSDSTPAPAKESSKSKETSKSKDVAESA